LCRYYTQNNESLMTRLLILVIIIALTSCKNQQAELLQQQVDQLKEQIDNTQEANTSLLDRMADLSVINKSGAESIQNSLENLTRQNAYIHDLTTKIHEKDSINFALVNNLKRSLVDQNDEDIQVEVRGSAVYISIADDMLFQSGSSQISPKAESILAKVAQIINDHDAIDVLVEGHTDNVPMSNDRVRDNWDLSVLRATSVVRELQTKHYVDPTRLTAAGRSHYIPKSENNTAEGRAENRRIEIIITPQLDQFFKLLEAPELMG
jgi:chemotaxis protein MotB